MRSTWRSCFLACAVFLFGQVIPAAMSAQGTGSRQTANHADLSAQSTGGSLDIRLPLLPNSVRFAVIGDSGTGQSEQYKLADQMELYRERVGFEIVIMLGDNIYGGHRPDDFRKKFELPYHNLIQSGVKFYASLGNHDDPNDERLYKPFNMNGQRYYSFKKGDVEFFALDSNYMSPEQLDWINHALQASKAKWKIAFFHHPLYSNGLTHGADLDLRARLTPLFRQYGVNAVFSGHEHVYERIAPRDSIYYFIVGNSGKLVTHDLKSTEEMQKGFDTDRSFMLVEIAGDRLFFQTIALAGETIDAGEVARGVPSSPPSSER